MRVQLKNQATYYAHFETWIVKRIVGTMTIILTVWTLTMIRQRMMFYSSQLTIVHGSTAAHAKFTIPSSNPSVMDPYMSLAKMRPAPPRHHSHSSSSSHSSISFTESFVRLL